MYSPDPPTEVKITTSIGMDANWYYIGMDVHLHKGFGKFVIEASAQSYIDIICSPVMIVWMSPTKRKLPPCQAKGKNNLITGLFEWGMIKDHSGYLNTYHIVCRVVNKIYISQGLTNIAYNHNNFKKDHCQSYHSTTLYIF